VSTTFRFDNLAWSWSQHVGPQNHPAGVIGEADGLVSLTFEDAWSGSATTTVTAVFHPATTGAVMEGFVMRFDGTITPCGAGSMMIVGLQRFDGPGAAGALSWEVIPDLGTGGLAHVTGWGSGTGTAGTAPGPGTMTGWLSCPSFF
jgi:hypothetical protein